jgi:polyhydroxybutyrate depolymerase
VTPTTAVVDSSAADAGPANRFDYAGGAPVRWWRLDGAGHTAPSRTVLSPPNPVTGIQNRDIEFAEIVWAFFKTRLP